MLCTLLDLEIEYEGINAVNCYLIVIDLQKATSKDKLVEILVYFKNFCDMYKKIYLLGIKKVEEGNESKITEKEIHQAIENLKVDYDYFEINMDKNIELSNKILGILQYCFKNSIDDNFNKEDNAGSSCFVC